MNKKTPIFLLFFSFFLLATAMSVNAESINLGLIDLDTNPNVQTIKTTEEPITTSSNLMSVVSNQGFFSLFATLEGVPSESKVGDKLSVVVRELEIEKSSSDGNWDSCKILIDPATNFNGCDVEYNEFPVSKMNLPLNSQRKFDFTWSYTIRECQAGKSGSFAVSIACFENGKPERWQSQWWGINDKYNVKALDVCSNPSSPTISSLKINTCSNDKIDYTLTINNGLCQAYSPVWNVKVDSKTIATNFVVSEIDIPRKTSRTYSNQIISGNFGSGNHKLEVCAGTACEAATCSSGEICKQNIGNADSCLDLEALSYCDDVSECKSGLVCAFDAVAKTKICTLQGGDVRCGSEIKPVCGIDNVTYTNACKATEAGIELKAEISCEELKSKEAAQISSTISPSELPANTKILLIKPGLELAKIASLTTNDLFGSICSSNSECSVNSSCNSLQSLESRKLISASTVNSILKSEEDSGLQSILSGEVSEDIPSGVSRNSPLAKHLFDSLNPLVQFNWFVDGTTSVVGSIKDFGATTQRILIASSTVEGLKNDDKSRVGICINQTVTVSKTEDDKASEKLIKRDKLRSLVIDTRNKETDFKTASILIANNICDANSDCSEKAECISLTAMVDDKLIDADFVSYLASNREDISGAGLVFDRFFTKVGKLIDYASLGIIGGGAEPVTFKETDKVKACVEKRAFSFDSFIESIQTTFGINDKQTAQTIVYIAIGIIALIIVASLSGGKK